MENTNAGENLEKQVLPPTDFSKEETVTVSKEDWEKVKELAFKHDRILKRQEGQTLDKEVIDTVQELAFNQKVNKLANEVNISQDMAEQLYKLKADFTSKDLENPLFKNFIEANRRQSRVSNNTPGGGFVQQASHGDPAKSRADNMAYFEAALKNR